MHGSDVSVVPQPTTKGFGEIDSIAQLITDKVQLTTSAKLLVNQVCVYIRTKVQTYSTYVCVYDMCGACLTLLRGHEQSEVTGLMCNKMYSTSCCGCHTVGKHILCKGLPASA